MSAVSTFGLSHRLLVRLAANEQPSDTPALAAAAGSRPRSVDRALVHLADDGLLEGVWTGEQWTEVRLTPRGQARAGRPQPLSVDGSRAPSAFTIAVRKARTRAEPATQAVAAGLAADFRSIPPAVARLRLSAAPRAAAIRLRAAATFRMFTTFP